MFFIFGKQHKTTQSTKLVFLSFLSIQREGRSENPNPKKPIKTEEDKESRAIKTDRDRRRAWQSCNRRFEKRRRRT